MQEATAGEVERPSHPAGQELGLVVAALAPAGARYGAKAATGAPRLRVRGLAAGPKLADVGFDLHRGEVLGVVALEGQGKDELFEALAGVRRPTAGTVEVDGRATAFRHPADAIAAGASPGGTVCWLVGRSGTVLVSTDGVRFVRVAAPAEMNLIGVAATDARTATVTGADRRRKPTSTQNESVLSGKTNEDFETHAG